MHFLPESIDDYVVKHSQEEPRVLAEYGARKDESIV